MDLVIDNEFRKLLIPLTEDEKEKLQLSLISNGCLDAIKVWNGIIVDGHHRYEICKEYGIEFRTQNMKFVDRDEALVWALENQLARRNLDAFQRGKVVLKVKDIESEQAKKRQSQALGEPRGVKKSVKEKLPEQKWHSGLRG